MYLQFYGLKEPPFGVTCDLQFFFEGSSHKEALASLIYGIKEKKGLILITGEVGVGKTILCKALMEKLPSSVRVSLLLNPYFSEIQLLQAIAEDFGLRIKKRTRLEIINEINSFLIEINRKGATAVLIIDEAQNLNFRQLEQLRLLSNLETSKEKLLQIILVGQPELIDKLNQSNLRQLRQRIFVKYHLSPLRKEEVKEYIEFRLKKAGNLFLKFSPQSYDIIYEFSQGIPRLINMICERALICGFVKERKILDEEIFRLCQKELG